MSDVDALLENKHLVEMLEFETQMFLDVLHKDGLVVAAKGLNLDRIFLNLFKVYCDPGNLILVLNCSEQEEKYFIEKLNDENVHSITFNTSISEREDLYLSGGIHFITTRILVVDMLKNRVPIDKITGIIILRAHTVLESCQEAFVLRLFRQKNKIGFIKAFSNNVQSFTVGFGHVERIMRTIFVKELYIWPRFHSIVVQSLKNHQPKVVELHIPISDTMSKIQTCILDLMNLTVKELKRINKTLELQEVTVENCLTKQFHKILQSQLDCIWHQLSSKSRQLLDDIKTLRHLILTMLYTDPVTFYAKLCTYRSMEYAQTSTWVLLEPAELLFTYASSLVFTGDKELNPEFCPKWKSLSEILEVEIPAEIEKSRNMDNKVLILCQDTKTCYQLKHFLTHGPRHYLFLMALKCGILFTSINDNFKSLQDLPEFSQHVSQKEKIEKLPKTAKRSKLDSSTTSNDSSNNDKSDGENDNLLLNDDLENMRNSYCLTMSQSICDNSKSQNNKNTKSNSEQTDCVFEPFTEMENMNLTQLCDAAKSAGPTILIQTFRNSDSFLELQKTLEEVQPNFIIMYHSNVTAIRNIELYEARRKNRESTLKIYFLIHAETVEEQSYLTSLRREKEAFEFLIETKSTMVVPEDQDGKSDDCITLQRDLTLPEVSTRQGGKPVTEIPRQTVIVDMREFRSELPALIHKRGIEIEPLTISVGDYILTPEICVERKSLSDLIGSLNSGRLYQQCTQMSRYYTKPMLLIEFDQNKPFSWQNNYMISIDSDNFDIQQKLLLLTLHFPKLKIVWSASPYASAQLFEELKADKEQPNVQYATTLENQHDFDVIETKFNTNIYDFVQKLPGINSKNIDSFLRNGKNLNTVINMAEDELKELLGNSKDGGALFSILHAEHLAKSNAEQKKRKGKLVDRFKNAGCK